ncbi:MATE efflux family protein LAL5 [Platanthera guangdongensis]|uniref:MATE efflux family protein LAL5 n=1 Tax=Platanthera guangdongensis TaxID=2320717 RepID=A0ABR2LFV7_9ASPA
MGWNAGIVRGCGWQNKSAIVGLGSYYLVGLPISILLAFKLQMGGKQSREKFLASDTSSPREAEQRLQAAVSSDVSGGFRRRRQQALLAAAAPVGPGGSTLGRGSSRRSASSSDPGGSAVRRWRSQVEVPGRRRRHERVVEESGELDKK